MELCIMDTAIIRKRHSTMILLFKDTTCVSVTGGVDYYFLSEQDYAAQCDEFFTNEIRRFKDGNSVLEEFEIDGKRLIDLIPFIEDCELY